MKDIRLILPLFLLILIVILLNGCSGIVPSPGTTDEDVTVITGQIKMPIACCVPVDEEQAMSKAYDDTEFWALVPGAVVELKNAGNCKVIDTTESDETGYYAFKDVKPGLYIITAYCPSNDRYLLKDVAEKVAGQALNTGIPNSDSTSLALVIEYQEDCYSDWYLCFNKWTEIYNLVKAIAGEVGEVDIPAIQAHQDFGNLDDEDYDDLVDLVYASLQSCCVSPGANGGGGGTNYTLTLTVNPEGAGSTSGAGTYSANTTANISASANSGWKFINWTGDISGDSMATSVLMNSNKTVTANFIEVPTYNVYYDGNGKTGGTEPQDPDDYEEGETVTVFSKGDLVKANYTFTGWNTDENGTGDSYIAGETFEMPAANVTLYAQWVRDCINFTLGRDYNIDDQHLPCTDTYLWWHAPCAHTSGCDYVKITITADKELFSGDVVILDFSQKSSNNKIMVEVSTYNGQTSNGTHDNASGIVTFEGPLAVGEAFYAIFRMANHDWGNIDYPDDVSTTLTLSSDLSCPNPPAIDIEFDDNYTLY